MSIHNKIHQPVLSQEVIAQLSPSTGESYLDLTAGYGGHAGLILDKLGNSGHATLVDRDQNAVEYLRERFKDDSRVEILHEDFAGASEQLLSSGKRYDCILADIGVSSPHLDNPSRGFSFMNDGPLDMRMDPSQETSAATLLNGSDEDTLANILFRYGEIKGSRKLAYNIVSKRPHRSTTELAAIIKDSTYGPNQMRVCAQVFQALRIAVNDELGQLEVSLPNWVSMLTPGGRLAVISFHSLEDRIVKQYFSEHGGDRFDSEFAILTKQPLTGTETEIVSNPRSRSAKLRVVRSEK